MNINREYISTNNTYDNNTPKWIVIHNTDNYRAGANAKTHASAQYHGDLQNMSAHYYTDDSGTAYQAAPHDKGCWHVGVNYGNNNMFGTVNNRNSIAIEMCVQSGYNYETAFQATVELTKHLMSELDIAADHVVRHYDVCTKHCPSAIIDHNDWNRFKSLLINSPKSSGTQAKYIVNIGRKAYDGDKNSQDTIIKLLGDSTQFAWKVYGFLPSVLIAQCILESGWLSFTDEAKTDGKGHTGLTPQSNNCLGMNKVLNGWIGNVWGGKYGYYWVPQEHDGTTTYGIETMREYADIEHCLADFAGFRTSQHPSIVGSTDYNLVIDNGLCGGDGGSAYATSSTYGPRLKAIIQKYNLTQYDSKEERKVLTFKIKTSKIGDNDTDTDHSVLQIQRHLIGMGFSCGPKGADGSYGTGTADAVSAYETFIYEKYGVNLGSTDENGNFKADGWAGEKVLNSMFLGVVD